MESFEELDLSAELVEALAAEGIERPTPLQEAGLPVVRRGNNLVALAGPGAGTLATWGAALLDRLEPAGEGPRALVLSPTREAAGAGAESLARLAGATGHTVAALGGPWVLPARADVLFATPGDVGAAAGRGEVDLGAVEAVVVDQASAIQRLEGLDALERALDFLPGGEQRVVFTLPTTPEIDDWVERAVKRAVHVPPRAAVSGKAPEVPDRGTLRYRSVAEPKEEDGLRAVAEILDGGDVRHLAVFFRSDDRAADVGDFLTLHGYRAGAPGDPDAPVWLAVDALATLPALEEAGSDAAVLSWDVPPGPDDLDRRHGGGRGGLVLSLSREFPHLRDVARRTGYRLTHAPRPSVEPVTGELADVLAAVEGALGEEDVAAYMVVLDDLFRRHGPREVAAGALALLRRKGARSPAAGGPAAPATRSGAPDRAPAFVRLFVSLGSRDGLGPGDVLGALTGESGVDGKRIGKIEVRESFSLVEVEQEVADRIIAALNGSSVRGRSVRVDYDRKGSGRPPAGAGRGGPGRGGGGRGGGGRKGGAARR